MLVTCFLAKSAQRRRLHLALDDRFPSHPAVACQPAVLQADLAFGVADIVCECHGMQHYADALGANLCVPLVVHLGTLHFVCLLRIRDCLQFLVLGIASPFLTVPLAIALCTRIVTQFLKSCT